MRTPGIYLDATGVLCVATGMYGEKWVEAICPKCNEPIPWILDMQSFVADQGVYKMVHARCAWTAEAFVKQGVQVLTGERADTDG